MESILFWTLVIAAVAIILMLALLIASERELKRTRAELGTQPSAFESADAANDTPTDPLGAEDQQLRAEVAALTEQLRSSQAIIARMRAEIQALRAESWRREESVPRRTESFEAEAMPSAPVEKPIALYAKHRFGKGRHKIRPMYVAGAIVILLAVVAAFSYTGKRFAKKPELAQIATPAIQPSVAGNAEPEREESADAAIDKPAEPEISRRARSPVKTTPLIGANYQIVRSTRVFSEPNDRSRPLARVEAGMEITVVGMQNDWLEVRSLHGRPSGFIKSDAAVIREPK
jgi:anti-sigma-K factor RskA